VGLHCFIDILKVKYFNNIIEQDHRFIKNITKPIMGFKAFHSASATLTGIGTAHKISKGQFANNQLPSHQQFIALEYSYVEQLAPLYCYKYLRQNRLLSQSMDYSRSALHTYNLEVGNTVYQQGKT
jgi:hypothetical protein